MGFIGMTLEGTPGIVNPAGITDGRASSTRSRRPTSTPTSCSTRASRPSCCCIHEGGAEAAPPTPIDPSGCANFTGPLTDIVAGLDPEFDLVVSGHTHRPYVCSLPNSAGSRSLATSAGTNGTLVTDITATLSKTRRRLHQPQRHERDRRERRQEPRRHLADDAPGVFVRNPALVDPETKTLIDKYRVAVAPIANRIVGSISADITRTNNAAGESALGDVIADAQLAYTAVGRGPDRLHEPGRHPRRPDVYANSPGGEAPGQVTYGEAFTVQPFNNLVTTQTFTGAQIKAVLEQQFPGAGRPTADPAGVRRLHLHLQHARAPLGSQGQQHEAERRARSTRPPATG